MAITEKAKEITKNYIVNEVFDKMYNTDKTRKEMMLDAGYSLTMSETKDPSKTNIYQELSASLINKVSYALFEYIDAIDRDVKSGAIELLTLEQKIKHASILTNLYKGVTPSYKKKVTTKDDKGYSTTWETLN